MWLFIGMVIMVVKLVVFEFIAHNVNLLFCIMIVNCGLKIVASKIVWGDSIGRLKEGKYARR